jgi:hypothetical protein
MLKLEHVMSNPDVFGEALAKLAILMGQMLIQTKSLESGSLTAEQAQKLKVQRFKRE